MLDYFRFRKLFFTLILLAYFPSSLIAEPGTGFGLAFEGGSFKATPHKNGKDFQSSASYGLSFDYQWEISQLFSFSILSFEHGGKSKLPPKSDYKYYKAGFVGAEIRTWIDSFFIGIHSGQYYLTWIESLKNSSDIGMISGNGFGFGLETQSGIFFAAYKEKSGVIKFRDMLNQKVEGSRFILGYRWR